MTSRNLRIHLSRSGRRLLALLVVAVLAVPVVQAAQRLRLNVDGDVFHVLTFDATVADVLDEHGVELAAGDEVLPAPSTPLTEVDAITVLRTIDVTLDVDGFETTHRGTWRTVEGMLADVGVEVEDEDVLRPGPRDVLEDGDTVEVTSPATVTLVADGEVRQVRTHLTSVGRVLRTLDIRVGEDDVLAPGRRAAVTDGLEIVVKRVGFDRVTEEVALAFTEEVRGTSELYTDESRVVQEGAEGLRVDTYRVRVVDGDRVKRTRLRQEVVTEPTTRIVEVGTTERPPPPPPTAVDDGSVWYDLAECESGGDWDYNGSSGFDGGLQFHPDTWTSHKPSDYPDYAYEASASQQIEVGKAVQASSGWDAWPSCAEQLGLT